MTNDQKEGLAIAATIVAVAVAGFAVCTWYAGRTDAHLRCVTIEKRNGGLTTRQAHNVCVARGIGHDAEGGNR